MSWRPLHITRNRKVRRILTIDGGGIRGIIPACVLAFIEQQQGKPINQLFDFIVGTSTGGILALALAVRAEGRTQLQSADQLVNLYERDGPRIFDNSLWRRLRSIGGLVEESYSHEGLEDLLGGYFRDLTMGDCRVPTMVTSYDIHNRCAIFFKSWSSQHANLPCCQVARATSAAPTYFEPTVMQWGGLDRTLIDGGVFVNSPSVSAYAEARKLFPDQPVAMMSLGTGELTRPILYDDARSWGSALWVMSLFDCMLDGASKAADYQMRLFLNEQYLRLQTPLSFASDDMDDASKGNIRNLRQISRELIKRETASIDAFFNFGG